jgi:hypothetical protein
MFVGYFVWSVVDEAGSGATWIWEPLTPLALRSPLAFVAVVVIALVGTVASIAIAFRYAASWSERFTRLPVGWLVMVISDVVRYLADRVYWEELHVALRETLENNRAQARSEVVVVAHSLGSVIAVDHLRCFPEEFPSAPITLVTMGSPLKRIIGPFFPSTYGAPLQVRAEIVRRHPIFRWLNVYRPFDPIGASLFGSRSRTDRSTRQYRRLMPWAAHTGYWGDEPVLRVAVDALRHVEFIQGVGERPGQSCAPPQHNPVFSVRLRRNIARTATSLCVVYPSLMIAAMPMILANWPIRRMVIMMGLTLMMSLPAKRLLYPYFMSIVGLPSGRGNI